MSDVKLGSIIEGDAHRDAIHIAVVPIIAAQKLYPGQDVGLVGDQATHATDNPVGIVDPFLKMPIHPGQRFYLVLYQNTVTGMRHHWSHPAFDNAPAPVSTKPTKEESETWLRNFCQLEDCPRYETIIKAVMGESIGDPDDISYSIDGDYFSFYGTDAHSDIPTEFWDHIENVTGRKMVDRPSSFSCSC